MRGTLVLWYEPVEPLDAQGIRTPRVAPTIEVHLNLWRDMPSWTNALDIGLKLSHMEALSRFYLYVPGLVKREHIRDLAPILRIGSTLNAVFNDVVSLGPETDASYDISVGGQGSMTVFFVSYHDIIIEPFKEDEHTIGSRIVFAKALCDRIKASGQKIIYIRIRIELLGPTANLFSSELVAGNRFFASTIGRLELTELRLNERRSYPQRILELAGHHNFDISAVHYFLIRDLQHRLVMQHAPFRKVRRLERNLWADYLAGDTSPRRFHLGAKLASRLVIYHWREKADEDSSLGDFIAFASFSASSASLIAYAIVIILLGAIGSTLAAGLSLILARYAPFAHYFTAYCKDDPVCGIEISDLLMAPLLALAIAAFVVAISLFAVCCGSVRRMVQSCRAAIKSWRSKHSATKIPPGEMP
jgi:hypothetical protein